MSNAITHQPEHDLANWISLGEAAARLPSPRTGKRTHSSTVLRLARRHGLQVRRRGHYSFVYWPQLFELMKPAENVRGDGGGDGGGVSVERIPRRSAKRDSARRTLLDQQRIHDELKKAGLA